MGRMKVIALDRQQGKTTELVKLAAQENLYIVCANRNMVRHTAQMARDMGLDIPFPITWDEFAAHRYYGRGIKGFVIDNLDICIQQSTAVPVRAVSLTVSAEPS